MPFGGRDTTERRRAILNFKRVEYLVRNKCTVTSVDPTGKQNRVLYAVEVAKTAMDDIPERALTQIEAADIVIALVVEPNPNVIYEIAYRRALDGTVVLVVDNTDISPSICNLWHTKVGSRTKFWSESTKSQTTHSASLLIFLWVSRRFKAGHRYI